MTTSPLLAQYDDNLSRYQEFCDRLRILLGQILLDRGMPPHSITCRLKSRESLCEKLATKGYRYQQLQDVSDIAGVRIVTYFADHVDRIAEIIEHEFLIDKVNSIDKRSVLDPDRFGYLSLHYVVQLSPNRAQLPEFRTFDGLKAEVQIRSILQHAWAEIEHDLGYKTAVEIPREIRRRFFRLAGLLEVADTEFAEIRDSLAKYGERVAIAMGQDPESVDIDKLSLIEFYRTSSIARRLDETISQNTFPRLTAKFDCFDVIAKLKFLGVRNVSALEELLIKHESRIYQLGYKLLARARVHPQGATLSRGVSLDFLCHVLAAEGGRERVISYLKKFPEGRPEERKTIIEDFLSVFVT